MESWDWVAPAYGKIYVGNGNVFSNRTPSHDGTGVFLSFDGVTTVIPGMMNIEHVKENVVSITNKSLSKDEQYIISNIYKSNNFFRET